jgi:hypothetical protein
MHGSPAEIISRQLDYLDISPWSWYRRDEWMSLGLGKASDETERTLVIGPPSDGLMSLYGCAKKSAGYWSSFVLARGSFDEVSEVANRYADKYGNSILAAKQRSWRKEPPTDPQLDFARRLAGAFKAGMTKGELAQSITHVLAVRTVQGNLWQLKFSQPAGSFAERINS